MVDCRRVRRLLVPWLLGLASCGRIGFTDRPDAQPQLDGLIAWFSFETPAETGVIDSIAGNNGSCAGSTCPTMVEGHLGSGYRFDGIDDCILVPDAIELAPPQFTVSLWGQQAIDGALTSISKRYAPGGNTWQIESKDNEVMWFTTRSGSVTDHLASPEAEVRVGDWQLATITWDGTTKHLYLDGVVVASGSVAPIVADSDGVEIGCDDNDPISGWYNGVIDEVQIYDRALTAAEVLELSRR